MSNNHARWPDLVFASVLLIAGLLMLRYGVWHLIHHREVVSPLLAGSGALVLGALSVRQVLRSRVAQARRYKRRHPAARTRWWFWAIVISASANGFASAQIAGATLSGIEMAPASSMVADRSSASRPCQENLISLIPGTGEWVETSRMSNRGRRSATFEGDCRPEEIKGN